MVSPGLKHTRNLCNGDKVSDSTNISRICNFQENMASKVMYRSVFLEASDRTFLGRAQANGLLRKEKKHFLMLHDSDKHNFMCRVRCEGSGREGSELCLGS